jgi:hypothetical protein
MIIILRNYSNIKRTLGASAHTVGLSCLWRDCDVQSRNLRKCSAWIVVRLRLGFAEPICGDSIGSSAGWGLRCNCCNKVCNAFVCFVFQIVSYIVKFNLSRIGILVLLKCSWSHKTSVLVLVLVLPDHTSTGVPWWLSRLCSCFPEMTSLLHSFKSVDRVDVVVLQPCRCGCCGGGVFVSCRIGRPTFSFRHSLWSVVVFLT